MRLLPKYEKKFKRHPLQFKNKGLSTANLSGTSSPNALKKKM
jgi:hypothetical protein